MIGWPAGVRIWLVAGVTDMRKGMDSLCALVQTVPAHAKSCASTRSDPL
jgi:hypothetical protein